MMLNNLTTKVIKMGFLEERMPHSTDKKKVVSARVSQNVLAALNSAEEDIGGLGYKFSIANIIDKALNDTLDEIKDKTGIDYYKLIIWGQKILNVERGLPATQALVPIDIVEEIKNFKDYFVVTKDLDGQLDFDEQLQRHEDSLVDHWNECIKDQNAEVAKNTLEIFYSEPSVGEFTSVPVKISSGHTVQTLSKLLKKTPDEVIEILNNAGVTGKNSDSRISTDDRQKLMNSLSKGYMGGLPYSIKIRK